MDLQLIGALAGIIMVDILLSGDNAIVIALVCRGLPAAQQRAGLIFGAATAVILRIVLALGAAALLAVPGVGILGGLFLIFVAAKMVAGEEEAGPERKPSTTLLRAVLTIAVADLGMSTDNVAAVAALSHGNAYLMAFGIALSVPLVIAGSKAVSVVLEKAPALVWLGAALLGYVAGETFAGDSLTHGSQVATFAPFVGLALVPLIGAAVYGLRVRNRHADAH